MPAAVLLAAALAAPLPDSPPPAGVVLVMADDLGFAQVGYPIGPRDEPHPALNTPHLNAMAANGLRLDGFRSAAFTCSPTRASVLTGRTNDRTGVREHGYPLNPNEITLAGLLGDAGYATGHFGKWHLDGLRGPGVPILKDDPLSPGRFGFDVWLSVTNFFDRDPLMSRGGNFEQFRGDSSEVIVEEALTFIRGRANAGEPFLAVVWYGSPHSPFVASEEDAAPFADLPGQSTNHHAEIAAMDRSLGALRAGLREAGVAENTLLWFCSDNGGLPGIEPSAVAPLRGSKGTIYEGGLRVPAIVEWPAAIEPGRNLRGADGHQRHSAHRLRRRRRRPAGPPAGRREPPPAPDGRGAGLDPPPARWASGSPAPPPGSTGTSSCSPPAAASGPRRSGIGSCTTCRRTRGRRETSPPSARRTWPGSRRRSRSGRRRSTPAPRGRITVPTRSRRPADRGCGPKRRGTPRSSTSGASGGRSTAPRSAGRATKTRRVAP